MFNRVSLTEAARVAFKIVRPFAMLVCVSLIAFSCYGLFLNGRVRAFYGSSPYGAVNVTLDSSAWVIGFDTTYVAPFEVSSETYESEPILVAVYDTFLSWDVSLWQLADNYAYWDAGSGFVGVRHWLVAGVSAACLLILLAGRPTIRFIRRRWSGTAKQKSH